VPIFFFFNSTKFNDAHVGDAHGCGLLGDQQFVGGTRQPIFRTNKMNEATKFRIIKNRVDLKRKNLPNGDFHHETTSMEEVVVVEGDTLVMAAHRNNGPEPAAQMAAVTENGHLFT
jgi:hypothetical protein